MKTKVALTFGAWLMVGTTALGQGQFLFNTHDLSAGNDVKFEDLEVPISGPDWFVQVFAGPDGSHLLPVLGSLLPLNRTGAGAGYTSPFSEIFTVAGTHAGDNVVVGYAAFHGSSYVAADIAFPILFGRGRVDLTEPPTPPNEVFLGVATVDLIPEPPTTVLGLLASAIFMMACGCKRLVRQIREILTVEQIGR
jgi:hypothetical protein